MPTLAERRAQQAANGGGSQNGDYIKFKTEGETKFLRFLFTDASAVESHKKYWDNDAKKMYFDDECPEGKGSYKITFNCVEYDNGGANPRRVRFEISEYLYNEYLSPYIEKDVPASKNVWEIKVRRPGTMDISYVAFLVNGVTEATYPIPEVAEAPQQTAAAPAAPTYAQPQTPAQAPAQAPAAQAQTPVAPAAPVQPAAPAAPAASPTPEAAPAPRKSKYF